MNVIADFGISGVWEWASESRGWRAGYWPMDEMPRDVPRPRAGASGEGQTQVPLLVFSQEYQIVSHHIWHMEVYDPVHEVETHKAHGEHDAGVLVDVRWGDSKQLVDVLQSVKLQSETPSSWISNTFFFYWHDSETDKSLTSVANECILKYPHKTFKILTFRENFPLVLWDSCIDRY